MKKEPKNFYLFSAGWAQLRDSDTTIFCFPQGGVRLGAIPASPKSDTGYEISPANSDTDEPAKE